MKYFNNYMDNVVKSANEYYRSAVDEFVANQWENTTLLSTIYEEVTLGSFTFESVDVWKNTVTEFLVNAQKDAKDYRRLLFKSPSKHYERGHFFNFDENYWMCYEASADESSYNDILVRRCNNVAKWIDKENGQLIEQPCILDYYVTATNPKIDKDIIVANSSTTLILQGNEASKKLKPNQRFIFNGTPYKFVAINNFLQNDYVDKDVTILFIDVDFDVAKPTDDIVNNVADAFEYGYKDSSDELKNGLVVEPIIKSIKEQTQETFEVSLYVDDIKQETQVNYSVSGAPQNCYTITRNGNVFTIKNHQQSTTPLTIRFNCDGYIQDINIVLTALY